VYKVVDTLEDNISFQKIYEEIAREQEFHIEETSKESVRYLFLDEGKKVGTLEVTPYNPELFSTVETDFAFSELDVIKNNRESAWEVDKVGILKDYRGKGLAIDVVHCLVHHREKYNFKYAVCLFEYRFYRMMRMTVPQEALAAVSERFTVLGETKPVIAVIVDMEMVDEWHKGTFIKHEKV